MHFGGVFFSDTKSDYSFGPVVLSKPERPGCVVRSYYICVDCVLKNLRTRSCQNDEKMDVNSPY